MSNPLLNFEGLPLYAEFRPEHIAPAHDFLLEAARKALAVATAPETPVAWETVVEDLTDATERVELLAHLLEQTTGLAETPEWREEFNKNVTRIPEFFTELGQNRELLARYQALAAAADFSSWPAARRAVVETAIREFRLSGVDLDETSRARFTANEKRLNEVGHRFDQNVTDATDAYQLTITDEARLEGIPDDVRTRYAEEARAAGREGWTIGLHEPSISPVLEYAADRPLRAAVYKAYAQRASEFGPPEKDNGPVMHEWLALLADQAHLLGYQHFADLSLVRKMAESPAHAIAFLRDLAARSLPKARQERRELEAFAQEILGDEPLEM